MSSPGFDFSLMFAIVDLGRGGGGGEESVSEHATSVLEGAW